MSDKMLKLILFVNVIVAGDCYKILGIFPYAGKSHFLAYEPLLKELAARGHHVTVLSEFPQKTSLARYRDIPIKTQQGPTIEVLNIKELPPHFLLKHTTSFLLSRFAQQTCDKLSLESVQNLIKSRETFDLILIEYFNTDCFLGFAYKFKVPFIGLSSCIAMPWHSDRVANPNNPAYVPMHFGDFAIPMTFLERLENTVATVMQNIIYKIFMDIPGDKIARKYFGKDMPPLSDIMYSTSLFLVNTHFSLQRAYPVVPSLIEVGGMHVGSLQELPKNIEKWIKESPHGVIYFSMGSMIKGDTFPEEKRRAFLRAFGRLQQRVLWKWENDTMPEKPDNVMIQKWMPQFDILCHPNVKAFISHGGLLGTTEAVHCGVPTIVMPQYGDQFTNARALEASGGGIILDFSTATEEDVYNTLRTVLEPSFNKKTKELSERFRDRPMSPLDTAVYWVEYVARHKGAHHLKTAAVGMPLYQYLLLDVIAFLAVVVIAISYISFYITRAIFRKLFKKQSKIKKN